MNLQQLTKVRCRYVLNRWKIYGKKNLPKIQSENTLHLSNFLENNSNITLNE